MSGDTIGKFGDEYRNVIRGILPLASETEIDEYLYGAGQDYDRTWEYWFAAKFGSFGLGRIGLEIAHPGSFFSLYAAAYHRRFVVSGLTPLHIHPGHAEWMKKMEAVNDVVDVANFQDLSADFYEGDPISNIFCFRLIENVEDDELFVGQLGKIIPPYGCMTFSFVFSHSAPFEYDTVAGFRVYNRQRLNWLFRDFDLVHGEAYEAAEDISLRPRPFDMTTYAVTVRKK